jgi:hypothetical protein
MKELDAELVDREINHVNPLLLRGQAMIDDKHAASSNIRVSFLFLKSY